MEKKGCSENSREESEIKKEIHKTVSKIDQKSKSKKAMQVLEDAIRRGVL